MYLQNGVKISGDLDISKIAIPSDTDPEYKTCFTLPQFPSDNYEFVITPLGHNAEYKTIIDENYAEYKFNACAVLKQIGNICIFSDGAVCVDFKTPDQITLL